MTLVFDILNNRTDIYPCSVSISGNSAYIRICPSRFRAAAKKGEILEMLNEVDRTTADYQHYERVLTLTQEQLLFALYNEFHFKEAGFQKVYSIEFECTTVS